MRIYIAGPYTAPTTEERDKNISVAEDAMYRILKAGHEPLCPHSHTKCWEEKHPDLDYEDYMRLSFAWLEQADCVFFLPGWEKSKGTLREREFAKEHHIPRYYTLEELLKG